MQHFRRTILSIFIFLLLLIFPTSTSFASSDSDNLTIEARVVGISEEKEIEVMGAKQLYQKIELELSSPNHKRIIVENGNQPLVNIIRYSLNDRVLVGSSIGPDGNQQYNIVDFIRKDSLILLSIIFVILLILVTMWKGLFSIFGMFFTFLVIYLYILPQILNGGNPVLVAIIGSIIIIPVSFYLAHGINKKTTTAIIGSLITLLITAFLGSIFVKLGHLTGLSTEEAGMLSLGQNNLNMRGVLLAGIVIGALGVLDDITISQAAIVDELANTAKLTKSRDLYSRSMIIGKDHITSMVNTLVLAYAGASLPLLLIFINNPRPFGDIVGYEMISEEIIRTLVGSIGLIISVPITTYIASLWFERGQSRH